MTLQQGWTPDDRNAFACPPGHRAGSVADAARSGSSPSAGSARAAPAAPPARGEAAAVVIGRPDNEGTTVTVGEARFRGGSRPPSYVVDVQLARVDDRHDVHLVVVAEDDGFRACGQL